MRFSYERICVVANADAVMMQSRHGKHTKHSLPLLPHVFSLFFQYLAR